ncbi:MAG: Efflux transporter, RND family, MFP subunit [Candidatus Magasanikbacteria bacterium GW2011_GWA2_37_8]|uniref:Efflux transporter, RND family, MFP subunit n=1 Tax=Candidatus Magasanikbacteria bacterium GW2011_GWA2_37_8 TaxID=1619036 RepID=A0A0G0HPJ4_9BACT|nr:MAG: Efflux transporter, RND family, MFP subunit [Candidatus Magasanikbacteria bacterium GW2011_GWA2_37_8]
MPFYKTKKFYIIVGVVLLVVLIGYSQYKKTHQAPVYETTSVLRGNLKQTVEATGKLQSANDLALRFEVPGTLADIKVKEGDVVKAGTWLANLRLAELNAAVAGASANLNLKLAGGNEYEVQYYQAIVDSAKADYEKTQADVLNSILNYESAVATAKNNLKLAEGGENSRIVSQEYEDAVAILQATVSKLDDALTQADNILGIDNTLANDSFQDYLSILDSSKLAVANGQYLTTKAARDIARNSIVGLTTLSSRTTIDEAIIKAEDALSKMSILLLKVSDVLVFTPPVGTLSQTTLDTKKTIIEASRVSITTAYTTIISEKQALSDAKNSYSNYLVAYTKAESDLANAKITSASIVAMKESLYNQAKANLDNKTKTPREVELAPLRASLAQAVASRDKAIIKAPIDGVIAKVNKKKGEVVSSGDVMIEMVTPHFEVEVDIPETDVSKLKVGASTTITLDAFGDDVKFDGLVLTIEPASTEIQDVVYYKVKVGINNTTLPIKPGMTANITVTTDTRENVLYIPSRAVRANGDKKVRVLVNNELQEIVVNTGLRADGGFVEITEGLKEGDAVVLSVKTN